MVDRRYNEENRLTWNAATRAHNRHKGDQAAFLRNGGSTLFAPEKALLGDISGKRLVHLQCNAGQDTLSLAQLGATVTGVDISDEAIDFARRLSDESGLPGTFHRSDVYDWLAETDERFDVAFSSYGALIWLEDLGEWARGVARVLVPGGRLVIQEFHPLLYALAMDSWTFGYDYGAFGRKVRISEDGVGDYVAAFFQARGQEPPGGTDFVNPHPDHSYPWTMAETVQAVLDAGLVLRRLTEDDWTPYPIHEGMREVEPDRWVPPEDLPAIPLLYGFEAVRPG